MSDSAVDGRAIMPPSPVSTVELTDDPSGEGRDASPEDVGTLGDGTDSGHEIDRPGFVEGVGELGGGPDDGRIDAPHRLECAAGSRPAGGQSLGADEARRGVDRVADDEPLAMQRASRTGTGSSSTLPC